MVRAFSTLPPALICALTPEVRSFVRTITQGELPTVVEGPCVVTAPFLAAALLAPPPLAHFLAFFSFWCVMAQMAHKWSHERRSALPAAVRALQDAHILITSKARTSARAGRRCG